MGEAWWRVAGSDLLGLVLPVDCAGCGADDVPWCDRCARALAGPAWRADAQAGRLDVLDGRSLLPVWAVADFTGPVRHAVSAWKDHGRADLTPMLAAAVRRAARAAVDGAGAPLAASGPVLVVPAPSTPATRRARGWDPVGALAAAVADELTRRGVAARRAPLLRRGAGADQAGLSARARSRNLAGQVHARPLRRAIPGTVVLVDDVLTTGATFAACVRALAAVGIGVATGVVVASTPVPGATRSSPAPSF